MRNILLVCCAAFMLLAGSLAHAQENEQPGTSPGCAYLNTSAQDGAYIASGFPDPLLMYAGEQVVISAFPFSGSAVTPTELTLSDFDDQTLQRTLLARADFPGTLTYTIPATDMLQLVWEVNPGSSTWAVVCGAAPVYTAAARARFNHPDEISVTRNERPNMVFEFGNPSTTPLVNPVLVCRIPTNQQATFVSASRGPFASVSIFGNGKGLFYTGLPAVQRGQNYNVQFRLNPGANIGQTSDVVCFLSGDNFALVGDRLRVRVR